MQHTGLSGLVAPRQRATGIDALLTGIQGLGEGFAGRGAAFAKEQTEQRQELSQERRQAALFDTRNAVNFLQLGDTAQALELFSNRRDNIQKLGGDPSDTQEIIQLIQTDPAQALAQLQRVEQEGVMRGLLPAPEAPGPGFTLGAGQQRFDAQGNKIAEGAAAPVKVDPLSAKIAATEQALGRKLSPQEIQQISGTAPRGPLVQNIVGGGGAIDRPLTEAEAGERGITPEDAKGLVVTGKGTIKAVPKSVTAQREADIEKGNITANQARLKVLGEATSSRRSSIKRAKTFLKQFESGNAQSGTTRAILDFVPGVFSKQAEFDQKFDAFAELAARAKLKAVGEVRPTNEDVEGMKNAIFGIGKDEPVNIELLQQFISEQEAEEADFIGLRSARKQGNIGTFVPGSVLPEGVTEDDIAVTMREENMTRQQVLEKLGGG